MQTFKHAWDGFVTLIRTQWNARIHLAMTVLVLVLAWRFKIDKGEWIAVLLAVSIVWITEAFNTAIEVICDMIEPNQNPKIKIIKDVAAGGVLIGAIISLAVGIIVFGPKIVTLFEKAV